MSKIPTILLWVSFVLLFLPAGLIPAQAESAKITKGISAKVAADYVHAIIEADRTIYSQYIVERLHKTVSLPATENWEQDDTLLLPAQFLSQASKLANSKDLGLSYRLMSLWPINPDNGPKTAFEKMGLEAVVNDPKTPHTGIIKTNETWYYQAVYPDLAVTKSCVSCHNSHPSSQKRDFQIGDVMGGIIITFKLDRPKDIDTNGRKIILPPEVVADYLHSIIESDRTVYSKYIVNRLQAKQIIHASENWWEEDTLLLPAQFLLNASDLLKNSRLGLDFRLISLWPINKHNGPANAFERKGLEKVAKKPYRPFVEHSNVANKSYFQAVYPDLAITPACVSCHNNHPKSPKHNFKLFDVMGGIIVTLPLDQDL